MNKKTGEDVMNECESKVEGYPRHKIGVKDWGPLIISPQLPEPLQGTKEAFRPDFDLLPMEEWPQWLLNMHLEGPAVGRTPDGRLLWIGGTVHDGIWTGENIIWMNGCFRDGLWLDGEWMNGSWIWGHRYAGTFWNGTWRDGYHHGGQFRGMWQHGCWLGGEWRGTKMTWGKAEYLTEQPAFYTP